MPNPDTDVDLSLEHYMYYKKYGVLPESAGRLVGAENRRRQSSLSRWPPQNALLQKCGSAFLGAQQAEGRAASGGALAPKPPCATCSTPECIFLHHLQSARVRTVPQNPLFFTFYNILICRGRGDLDSDSSEEHGIKQSSRPTSRARTSKVSLALKNKSAPMKSSSQSVWQNYDDDDDDDVFGNENAKPRTKNRKSKSPARTRVSDKNGQSPKATSPYTKGGTSSIEDDEWESDGTKKTKDRIKVLLEKLLNSGAHLDDQFDLDSLLNSHTVRNDSGHDSREADGKGLAEAHRLRQTHAGAFYGWRNVQEMTVKLNQDVNALEKRIDRRRHVEDLENWREKKNSTLCCSATPESKEKESLSALDQSVRAALRKSLLSTNGEPRTARGLKRAVLEQWTRVLETDDDPAQGTPEQTAEEETVRMVLDLEFKEVEKNMGRFSATLQKDVSGALGTDCKGILIRHVEAGSVIVTLGLLPAADGRSALVTPRLPHLLCRVDTVERAATRNSLQILFPN